MLIMLMLGIPAALAILAAFFGRRPGFGRVNAFGYAVNACAGAALFYRVLRSGVTVSLGAISVDALGAFFVMVTSIISCAGALYSVGYIARDAASGAITRRKAGGYYVLYNLFCLSMLAAPSVGNLGILWVAIEMTTLVSAFLVGFYNTRASVEAAWKYIIICSAGIIFALLGTILFSFAFSATAAAKSLDWTSLTGAATLADRGLLKIAFVFILVGYGTKAGLAPMHTWLPDAHSQAVSPVSALLSGVLLKTALYAILRFGAIVIKGVGFEFFGSLMLFFGVLSLLISCGFIIVQKDLKRLLAYSSIEHLGIVAVGFGLGPAIGFAAATLHIFCHAVTKSFMFICAGEIVHEYATHDIRSIRGVIAASPYTGVMALAGVFALTGFPPFPLFASELAIVGASFLQGSYLVGAALLAVLAAVFGAFIYHFSGMLFGAPVPGLGHRATMPPAGRVALAFLLTLLCAASAALPFIYKDIAWITQRLYPL